jgi:hypothetical protein
MRLLLVEALVLLNWENNQKRRPPSDELEDHYRVERERLREFLRRLSEDRLAAD